MDQMRDELQNPSNFLPLEKFCQPTKYALIVCNQIYNKKYITLGNLPAVVDDFKNAKHTAKMMGILPENTIELRDASANEMDAIIEWLTHRIVALTRVLSQKTGILGIGVM